MAHTPRAKSPSYPEVTGSDNPYYVPQLLVMKTIPLSKGVGVKTLLVLPKAPLTTMAWVLVVAWSQVLTTLDHFRDMESGTHQFKLLVILRKALTPLDPCLDME